jgi:hypothetical protein
MFILDSTCLSLENAMLKRQFLALLLAGVALPFCSHAADKPTIKIGYVEGWSDSVATTNVAANIIRNKLGYPVEMVPVAAGIMWQGWPVATWTPRCRPGCPPPTKRITASSRTRWWMWRSTTPVPRSA